MTSDIIRGLRERRGMTQGALAKRCGVSEQAVRKWESGESEPKLNNFVELIKALGTTPEVLLGLTSKDEYIYVGEISEKKRAAISEMVQIFLNMTE